MYSRPGEKFFFAFFFLSRKKKVAEGKGGKGLHKEDPITNGICRAIAGAFAPCAVALGPVRQGLEPPHFFVECRKAMQRVYPNKRFLSENEFCVTYLPADSACAKEECAETAQKLFGCLACIETELGSMRGMRMSASFENGRLAFAVRYAYFFYRPGEVVMMEELTQIHTSRRSQPDNRKG